MTESETQQLKKRITVSSANNELLRYVHSSGTAGDDHFNQLSSINKIHSL